MFDQWRTRRLAVGLIAIALVAGPATAADYYLLRDLGTLSGDESSGFGLNNQGLVVGAGEVTTGWNHGFIGDDQIFDVGTPGTFLQSHLDAVNNVGQAVGWADSDYADVEGMAYLYDNGSWTELGTLAGYDFSRAFDINDAGQVVGRAYVRWRPPYSRAWIWESGTLTQLPMGNHYETSAYAISNSGEFIVGSANGDNPGRSQAAVWTGGAITRLGHISGSSTSSSAVDVNDSGLAVGSLRTTVYIFTSGTAAMWNVRTGAQTLLPEPSGWNSTYGLGVNEHGQIVGEMIGTPDPGYDAFIFENGETRPLTPLLLDPDGVWAMMSAQDINDAGQIIGTAVYDGGDTHAVLLSPVNMGDLNCDGTVSAADIDPFVTALTDPSAYGAAFPDCSLMLADTNGDGEVTAADIDPFVALLVGG
jgi:probable HAF family extracellular repeat protein